MYQVENPMTLYSEEMEDSLKVAMICDECKEPIYDGDDYFTIEDDIICDHCMIDYMYRYKKRTAHIMD